MSRVGLMPHLLFVNDAMNVIEWLLISFVSMNWLETWDVYDVRCVTLRGCA